MQRLTECSGIKALKRLLTYGGVDNLASIQSALAGVPEGDDGRLDQHHPHTRFQRLGTRSTAAERQARLTGSRSGLLEQPGSSASESGRLSAYSLHQHSLELLLRISV